MSQVNNEVLQSSAHMLANDDRLYKVGTPEQIFPEFVDGIYGLENLQKIVRAANEQWWLDLKTGEPLQRNKGELLCLIHSEVSECLEGVRRNLMDDKLPHRSMEEVELADAVIRILDYCGGFGLDLAGAVAEKLAFNLRRKDHSREERLSENGKKV